MWEQGGYDNAGGFYNESQAGEAKTPGGSSERKRANNIVPVTIRNILDSNEEGLKVEGLDVGIATIIARVTRVEHSETKATYGLEDNSGAIDAIMWKDEQTGRGMDENEIQEGQDIRVIGSIRTQQENKYIMAFKLAPISCEEEMDAHKLEVQHTKLIIKRMNDKENAAIGANYGLSNSMVGAGNPPPSNTNSFGNSKYDAVYKMVSGCTREEGISRDELSQALASKMSRSDVDNAIEYLSNEGHVYSTTDEDHFKTTDS